MREPPLHTGTPGKVLIVYGAAFLQGLTLVSFPASSSVLMDTYGFTSSQYGLIFIPQIFTAILGSLAGGSLVRRIGLRNLLVIALLSNVLSQAGLGAVVFLEPGHALYAALAATALLGLGFGAAAAPLNTYPGLLFPQRRESALVALHTLLGIGMSAGSLVAGRLAGQGRWIVFPLLLLVGGGLLAAATPLSGLSAYAESPSAKAVSDSAEGPLKSPVLWTFAAIACFYAVVEGTFSNWAIVFLHEERGIEIGRAALALSGFWAMIAAGRLFVSVLLLKVSAVKVWLVLPLLMAGAFLLLPLARTAASGIVLFSFAGLACSAFFPVTVGLISKRFPSQAPFVSSLMIAALMIGVGVGSYVIGPLRSTFPLDRLYRYSALYPAVVFALALSMKGNQCRETGGG